MHVAGHGRVHLHEDGTRHIHRGSKPEGALHRHQDGTTHDHSTGVHTHQNGTAHQHAAKPEKKSTLGLDTMECCGPKGACCSACGGSPCTCCNTAKPATGSRTAKPLADDASAAPTAGAASIQSLDWQPLLSWLQRYF